MKYKIVSSNNEHAIEELVAELYSQGWRLHGYLTTCKYEGPAVYTQAMVKYEYTV